MHEFDPVRVALVSHLERLGLDMKAASRQVGRNASYLQQFIKRGIPRDLPEDVREALAPLLGVSADSLRGKTSGKGGPKPAAPDAIAQNTGEIDVLRAYRELPESAQTRAIAVIKALS